MGGFLLFALIVLAAYWIYHRFLPSQGGRTSIDSQGRTSPESSGSQDSIAAYFREKDSLERHALKQEAHIQNNSTEPDQEGFVGYKGTWRDEFYIRTQDGSTFRGRIKLGGGLMITVKEKGFGGKRVTLDLRKVEVE